MAYIKEKTADFTVVWQTVIDTLHKEGTLQKVIILEASCTYCCIQA